MTLGIIFALTCGLLWAFIGVLYSTMARRRMQFFAVMGPAFIVTAIAAWVFLADYHTLFFGKTNGTASLAWLMIPSGILTVLGMVCMQTAMRRGHHAACWTIGQSALIAPYLCGVFFFGEPLLARKAFGVALILASLVAFGRARRKTETEEPANGGWGWLGLSIACLALLSIQQTLTTLPSHWPNWTDSLRLRVPLMFTGVALAYGSGALLTKQRPGRTELAISAGMVCISLPSHYCLYKAMDCLTESHMVGLVYPLAVGTCILGFALYSLVILKEKTTAFHALGVLIGIGGIILLSI